jgi:hypothetical protein
MMILDIHIIMVVLINELFAYVFKLFRGKYFQQIPGLVETVENRSNVIWSLSDELIFKSLEKL